MSRLFIPLNRHATLCMLLFVILLNSLFISCNKNEHFPIFGNNSASRFSSDVIDKWITMQVRLERNAVGIPNPAFLRYYAYSCIAAFEALAPGTALGTSITIVI